MIPLWSSAQPVPDQYLVGKNVAQPVPNQSLVETSDLYSSSTHYLIIKDEPPESKPTESPQFKLTSNPVFQKVFPTEVPSLAALTSESKPDESQTVLITSDPVLLSELPPLDDPTSDSKPDNSQTVQLTSDPVLLSEVTSSDDVITAKNEDPTVQILFINIDSNDQVSIPLIPSHQEESPSESYPAVYPVPPPSNLVVSFNWDQLVNPRLPISIPFRIIVQV